MKKLRIGMLRIAQETNAFSPFVTRLTAFRHYRRGQDLLDATSRYAWEVPGGMRSAELSGFRAAVDRHGKGRVEIVPLFSAWALPAGPLGADVIAHFDQELRKSLAEAGELDGIFFSLHGSLQGEGDVRPEADWLQILREHVKDAPIAVSADLHAHLTQRFVDRVDIFCAYRTNPHRDHKSTGYRAGHLLLRTLFGEIRPTIAWRTLPMIQGGGITLDFLPPVRPIFRRLTALEKQGRVLDASLLMVHLWLKAPDLGWSVVVMTDGDADGAESIAEELAEMAWNVRHHLPPELPSPEEAVRMAREARVRRKLGVVCICDASDVVGAGAPGTNTAILKVLLEQARGMRSYIAIRDASVVEALWDAPLHSPVQTELGGKEEGSAPAVAVSGTLRGRDDDQVFGKMVVLDLGHVQCIVCADPPLAMQPSFYRKRGLRISKADIVVVKSFFPFRLFFGLHNRKTIYVRSRGATDFDRAVDQDFDHPVFPKDDPADWRHADRERRRG